VLIIILLAFLFSQNTRLNTALKNVSFIVYNKINKSHLQLVSQLVIVYEYLDSNTIKMNIYYDHQLKGYVDELQQND
jgi:hypothetical protein